MKRKEEREKKRKNLSIMEGKKKSEMIERHVIRDLKSARKQDDPNERN